MSRILLVAATTGYQTRSFTEAARRQGIDVILATDRCHILEDPWRDRAIPLRFENPRESAESLAETVGARTARERSQSLSIDGIVAVADSPTLIAALAAEKLGIPYHPPAAVAACRDKHRMRELFAAAGLPVPRNFRLPLDADPRASARSVTFPCVLKPLGLSASRGVIRANNPDEFVSAFDRIRHILRRPEILRLKEEWNQAVQIEDYIPGREFALEGLLTHGGLKILALFDKPDPLEGPFFEETIYITPSREPAPIQEALRKNVIRAVEALGLRHGPIHAEMRVNPAGVMMLEIAARPIGGLCARALGFTLPSGIRITLEELVCLHAIGRTPTELAPAAPASGVMMIPVPQPGVYESVSGIEEARNTAGIDDIVITAKTGQDLQPLPEGASYPGFIFATGASPQAVETSLRLAHSRLTLEFRRSLAVINP
jgi:biotin carboxylase